jgi:isopenicillin N synthase-like dioxygenase
VKRIRPVSIAGYIQYTVLHNITLTLNHLTLLHVPQVCQCQAPSHTSSGASSIGSSLTHKPPFLRRYTTAMLQLQARMMDIVAASFGTDPKTGVTADILRDAVINWRFLHYPSSDEPDVIGVGAHTGERGLPLPHRDRAESTRTSTSTHLQTVTVVVTVQGMAWHR